MKKSPDNFEEEIAFEAALRSAMSARPEPFAPTNLAARAMDMARSAIADAARRKAIFLARQRRWAQLSAIAATLLIASLLAVAASKIHSRGDFAYVVSTFTTTTSTDASTTATSTTDTSADSSTSSTSTTDSTFLGVSVSGTVVACCLGGLLVVGMIWMTLSRGATPDSWGPDAAAGVW